MNYTEYGSEHKDVILLLHGGGLGAWNFDEAAGMLCTRFHVVLPVLDGHAGSSDPFVGIRENAQRILDFIDERFSGHVLLLGGLSLGAQIAAEMLALRPDVCRYALFESPSLIPSPALTPYFSSAWAPVYRLTQYRWFARWQFSYLRIKKECFEEYYQSTKDLSTDNLLAFLKASTLYELNPVISRTSARVLILCGEKEQSVILRSARLLHDALPESLLKLHQGLHHGELSLNHSEIYVQEILSLIEG